MSDIDQESLDQAMGLPGRLMRVRGRPAIHLVVCGGSALIALGLVTRTTQDVDVLATLEDGPADENLFRLGLPVGVAERLVNRDFGAALQVGFISRYDQIHFKLYAAADQGGRHFTDLRRLKPSPEELLAAARWSFTQDASPAFRHVVV